MPKKIPLTVRFFRTSTGREPVREWLRNLDRETKKAIGEDIKTVQFGWPLGMPVVRKLDRDLWEIRSSLPRSVARVVFTLHGNTIVLLHGFIKKSQKTPRKDLAVAFDRLRTLRGES